MEKTKKYGRVLFDASVIQEARDELRNVLQDGDFQLPSRNIAREEENWSSTRTKSSERASDLRITM
jgi:hypothetical protein